MQTTRRSMLVIITLFAYVMPGFGQKAQTKATLNTALLRAAGHDRAAEVKAFLAKGADPNAKGWNGYTPIMWVAFKSDAATIQTLQKAGGDINAVDTDGNTALMHAAPFDWVKQARVLLARGANVNIADNNGQTALMDAAENGWERTVRLLLNHNAKVNVQNRNGQTALLLTVAQPSEASAQRGVVSPADAAALRVRFDSLSPAARARITKYYGLPVNASTSAFIQKVYAMPANSSALTQKFYARRVRVVRMLLSKGANVNIKPKNGFTPLMGAAHYGNVEMVKDLLKEHPDVNARDYKGRTVLQIAMQGRKPEVVTRLLKRAGAKQ